MTNLFDLHLTVVSNSRRLLYTHEGSRTAANVVYWVRKNSSTLFGAGKISLRSVMVPIGVSSALSNGATLAQIERKLRDELYSTWVSSVYVWAPVQVFQQAVVPLRYRVAVANGVSYFWDTYLSLCMMPHPAEATGRPEPEVLPPTAKLVRRRTMV